MTDCVDFTRIQETSEGDAEFETELIEMYLEDAKVHIDNIAAHMNKPDDLKRIAHTLKGSSANIGAVGVQKVALDIEKCADENSMDETMMNTLREVFEETSTVYKNYVQTL